LKVERHVTGPAQGPQPTAPAPPPGSRSLLDLLFGTVRIPREAPAALGALAQHGTVVLVMRAPGLLQLLFARWVAPRLGLPPVAAAAGYRSFAARLLGIRRSRPGFAATITRGGTVVVFLGRGRDLAPFVQLLALRAKREQPIHLIPALLTWSRRAPRLRPSIWDLLYGAPEDPSLLANVIGFVRNRNRATFDLGEPVEAGQFAAAHSNTASLGQAGRLRARLHLHLSHEFRAAVGPPLKAPSRVHNKVLRDRTLQSVVDRVALETGRPRWKVVVEAERDLEELASRYRPGLIEFVRPILSWAFWRLYDGVEVDEEGFARLRRAAAQAPIVLCPSHKSYVDFIVLSWILVERGMTPPHIAAGINLSFWPFGTIARAGGAFFIRRKVKGDRIYTAVLRAYVKHLLRDGFPQEFYVEGTRSRTGKLLSPKTGLVSMEVDAWLDGAAPDVIFVPVSIDYERLIEAGSYARELAGGEKKKETLRGLLGIFSILTRRYERLYVQFETPISLAAVARERLGDGASSLAVDEAWSGEAGNSAATGSGPEAKRGLVQAITNRVAWGIARAATVTPVGLVATALLADAGPPASADAITRRIELLRYLAAEDGARFARGLEGASSDPRAAGPIAGALRRFVKEKLVRPVGSADSLSWQVVPDRRPLVDFHRNAVLHRYVALAIVAASVLAPGVSRAKGQVFERAGWISRLLKLEFLYQPGASAEEAFESLVALLERLGAIERAGGELRPGANPEPLQFLAGLTRPFLESYRLTFETALHRLGHAARRRPLTRRRMVTGTMEDGREQLARGRLTLSEAVSNATVENAVEWLILGQLLRETETGELRPGADPQALRRVVDLMNPLLAS
jgi:glycerol-3-phosphate O-acyltransferase